jgi:AraC-like DNA-binding protein
MALIVVMHENPDARARLRRAVLLAEASGFRHSVQFTRAWEDLRECQALGSSAIRVVDAYPASKLEELEIRSLVDNARHAPVVVYSDFRMRPAMDVLRLKELGIRHCISQEVDDDPDQIRRTIADALGATGASRIVLELEKRISPEAVNTIMSAFRAVELSLGTPANAGRPRQRAGRMKSALAKQLRLDLKEVQRLCATLGLPTPGRLMRWCRLMHAAQQLADRDSSCADVAHVTGFGDERTLRRTIHELLGLSSRELRRGDPLHTVLVRMLDMISRQSHLNDEQ